MILYYHFEQYLINNKFDFCFLLKNTIFAKKQSKNQLI